MIFQGLRGERNQELVANVLGISFGDDEHVLELDSCVVYTTL